MGTSKAGQQLGRAWLRSDNGSDQKRGRGWGCLNNAGVLTFQGTGEDAHCTGGLAAASWLLEAVHTWSLGRRVWGPAWLLRWCGLGVTEMCVSLGMDGGPPGPGAVAPDSGWGGPRGHHRGLDVTRGTGLLCSQLLQDNTSPLANHYLLSCSFPAPSLISGDSWAGK